MATVPMTIVNRPFSIEPLTGIMLPDGIFDTAIFEQSITCYYTNMSQQELKNVNIYFEGVGDLNILVTPHSYYFSSIPAGASVQVYWLGNFQNTTAGKKNVSIIAIADGYNLKREIKQIFVTSTTYDSSTNKYTCQVPEGNMVVDILSGIISKETCKERGTLPSLWIPVKMNMQVIPNPPYSGQFSDIPFQDPWWKIVAIIVAALAAIGAAIASALGSGKTSVGVSGKFEEVSGDIDCCKPSDGLSMEERLTVAGALSSVASGAIIVAASDEKDPWYRGQENTAPTANEVTMSETVEMEISYSAPPQAGEPYLVEVKWTYHRFTDLQHYTYSVSETQKNIHILEKLEVFAPSTLKLEHEPFVFSAKFIRENDSIFKGIELFAFALVVSPSDVAFRIPLLDDGINFDKEANDGVYTGFLDWQAAIRAHYQKPEGKKIDDLLIGFWKIYIYAQDINDASAEMKPTEAATHIGGMMITSAAKIKFDSSLPCPLTADAAIHVIP